VYTVGVRETQNGNPGILESMVLRLFCCAFVAPLFSFAQGMSAGNATAQRARPLPKGVTPPTVRYEDVADAGGLTGINVSGAERGKQFIVETTGNGVAILDYDGDGLRDILLVNAGRFDNATVRHHLYRNLGGLKFEDATEKAGLQHTGWGQGVCAGDVDDDGKPDLLITQWGQNVLYRNQGAGAFKDETEARGLTQPKPRWTTGCAFLDYDRDGDLDLFLAHYIQFDPKNTPKPGEKAQCQWKGIPVICGPRGLPAESVTLMRNDAGRFVDVTQKAGVAVTRSYYAFTVLTADFDNDGWTDVYVACDSTASLLFRNRRNGTFEEIGVISGTAFNEDGREQAGMGATAGDYDGDGLLDIFKTNFSDDTPTLYRNVGDGNFTDNTIAAGLGVNTKFLGWGAAFLDADHDGWKDILQVNGHVYPEVDAAPVNEKFKQSRVLYWNRRDGQFHDLSAAAGPGITTPHASRGLAIGDLDNDGTLEAVVVNMHEGPSLLRNTVKPSGGALLVEALTASGRDAVGARVTVTAGTRRQIDEIRSGGYHISQSDMRVHFGLGGAAQVRVGIRWPDGTQEDLGVTAANQWITARQGKGIVRSQKLP